MQLEGDAPSGQPCVYVTAHLGSLQALRYALRARNIPAATVLGPHNLDRDRAAAQDRVFVDATARFPSCVLASQVHRLRGALNRGSLVVAADLPLEDGIAAPLLGGWVRIDPRPFRLAHAARVPCRPAFATLPGGQWTLTLGSPLPVDASAAAEAFALALGNVAARAPLDLDGVVYAHIAERGR